ncbi:MAG: hypothetical protein WEA82_00265 [Idiomarina sp.]
MKLKLLWRPASVLLAALYLFGCDSSSESQPDIDYVASVPSSPVYYGTGLEFTPIVGVPAQTENGERVFVDDLYNFDYQLGTSYELRLVTYLAGDGTYFKVDEIISAQPDPIGTLYTYSEVELVRTSFTEKSAGVFAFFGYPFVCAADVDCASLVAINQSGGLVEVEFEYTGGTVPMTLVRWN